MYGFDFAGVRRQLARVAALSVACAVLVGVADVSIHLHRGRYDASLLFLRTTVSVGLARREEQREHLED